MFSQNLTAAEFLQGQNIFRAKAMSVQQTFDKEKPSRETRSKTKRKVETSTNEDDKRDTVKVRKQV